MSMVKRIMIVDDHPIFLNGLSEVIQKSQKCLIDQAHDGETAIRLIRVMNPDLVILDIEMPGMNGLEVAKHIQTEYPEMKTILLTMHNNPVAFDLAMKYDVNGYVLKENAITEILTSIESVLNDEQYVSPQMMDSLSRGRRKKDRAQLSDLTPTELTILKLISENLTSREIAEQLFISEKTVSNHRQNISTKLGLKGAYMLLRFALENRSILRTPII